MRSVAHNDAGPPGNLLLNATIAGHFLHAASFNGLPDMFRLLLGGILMSAHVILLARARETFERPLMLLPQILVLGAPILGLLLLDTPTETSELPKLALLALIPLTFFVYRHEINLGLLATLVTLSVLAMTAIGVGGYPYDYNGSTRLAPFTGGEGVHPSAYFALTQLLLAAALHRTGAMTRGHYLFLALLCVVALIGYAVRTTHAMLAVVLGFGLLFAAVGTWRERSVIIALVAFIALAAFVVLLIGGFDFDQFSSGRLATYEHRVQLLLNRDFLPLLFGTGLGTDWFRAGDWWWENKNAHNDYLHYLIEIGCVGTLGVCLLVWQMWERSELWGRAFVLAVVVGGAVSNALLMRPQILCFGLMFCAILAAHVERVNAWRATVDDPDAFDPMHGPYRHVEGQAR